MAPQPRPWIVTKHDPISRIDDHIWTVDGVVPGVPGGNFPRKMTIVKLPDGKVLLYNAIPLDERGLAELAAIGEPSLLVVPSQFHCIDAHAVRERFGARVLCPKACSAEISRRVPVDGHLDALPGEVEGVSLAGTRNGEAVLWVRGGHGATLLVCDVFLNVSHLPGFWGWVWKVFGFTGPAAPSRLWRRKVMGDHAALAQHLRQLADTPDLCRVIPSHGPAVDTSAADFLRGVAAGLAERR